VLTLFSCLEALPRRSSRGRSRWLDDFRYWRLMNSPAPLPRYGTSLPKHRQKKIVILGEGVPLQISLPNLKASVPRSLRDARKPAAASGPLPQLPPSANKRLTLQAHSSCSWKRCSSEWCTRLSHPPTLSSCSPGSSRPEPPALWSAWYFGDLRRATRASAWQCRRICRRPCLPHPAMGRRARSALAKSNYRLGKRQDSIRILCPSCGFGRCWVRYGVQSPAEAGARCRSRSA
jgi:hypothetical protein